MTGIQSISTGRSSQGTAEIREVGHMTWSHSLPSSLQLHGSNAGGGSTTRTAGHWHIIDRRPRRDTPAHSVKLSLDFEWLATVV